MTEFSVLNVNEPLTNARLSVTNLMGQDVLNLGNLDGNEFTIHKNALPQGLYIIRVFEKEETIFNSKLVIH